MNGVHVRVPATSANIGPGFDSVGIALALYADFWCEKIEAGLEISGCPEEFQNKDNLFVQAFRMAESRMGVAHAPIKLHIQTEVPVSRGLGSSATLLAGGAYAASVLYGNLLTEQDILEICNEIEGHPDNAAPAVMGGLCASFLENGKPITVKIPVSERIGFVALIPNFETMTADMRKVLPGQIPFADAVFNASRLAVLLRALEIGALDLIARALDDRLHQPYRKHLIHEYELAERAALENGCAGFCISGSGSTCLGIVDSSIQDEVAARIQTKLNGSPYEWRAIPLALDRFGAHVIAEKDTLL